LDKAGIAVPSKDKLSGVVDTLISAVRAGELDDMFAQASKQRLIAPQPTWRCYNWLGGAAADRRKQTDRQSGRGDNCRRRHSLKEPFACGRNAELRTRRFPAAASEFIEDARIKWPFEEPDWGEWVQTKILAPYWGFFSTGHFAGHERKFGRDFKGILSEPYREFESRLVRQQVIDIADKL
jgi:hypothetical protein